jgi:2-polyprenyl-3-methyl-5-hydroxy-6-metoxy-1,4-benzoquinol methylase
MRDQEFDSIYKLEETYWWYRNLHDLVIKALRVKRISEDSRIVDAGCGTGGLLKRLSNEGFYHTEGFDISEYAIHKTRQRGLKAQVNSIHNLKAIYNKETIDVLICNDMFYFIPEKEQSEVMRSIEWVLKPDGLLLMNLPAMKMFRGMHDLEVGINKRFEKKDIQRLTEGNDMFIRKVILWPLMISPAMLLMRWSQRRRIKKNPGIMSVSDLKPLHPLMNGLFYQITKFENYLLPVKPIGSSIFLILQKQKHE